MFLKKDKMAACANGKSCVKSTRIMGGYDYFLKYFECSYTVYINIFFT